MPPRAYNLVRLGNGSYTLHSQVYDEKMHPGLGPAREAELLYVRQLKIRERLAQHRGEFVVWDVGLGAAANAIAVLRAAREFPSPLRLVSFDNTLEPLAFALRHAEALGYLHGYEGPAQAMLEDGRIHFDNGKCRANWEFHLGDFPARLSGVVAGVPPAVEPGILPGGMAPAHSVRPESSSARPGGRMPSSTSGGTPDTTRLAPHAILFDAFSPAKNPAMWTLPLFTNLFRLLDPARPCNLTTYSRSTMIRVTLLLAGFFVGRGVASGRKEETTVAANRLELIDEPLDREWRERARRSDSAEPLHEAVYCRARISSGSWQKLRTHPQFG